MANDRTTHVQQCLARLRLGESSAEDELIRGVSERLSQLTRVMFRDYQRVRRWEDTDDVLQNALVRLHRALKSVVPETPRDFYRLATLQIRRELIDLARNYFGPEGLGVREGWPANHVERTDHSGANLLADSTYNPDRLRAWTEFHRQVDELPAEEREVFDLLWYQDLKQIEAAEVLDVAPRTVMRRWHRACLKLHDAMHVIMPGG